MKYLEANFSNILFLGKKVTISKMGNNMICMTNVLIILLFIKCLYGAEDDKQNIIDGKNPDYKEMNITSSTGKSFLKN